jgi:hypothetical protein
LLDSSVFHGAHFFSLFGYTIPESSRYLVGIVFGLFGGLAFYFISGTAMASGTIPIPRTQTQLSIKVGGGIAATVILSLVGYWMTRGDTLPVLLGIDNVRTFPSKDAKTLTVQVDYHLQGWDETQSCFLEASWKKDFSQPIRKRLDNPRDGQATFDLNLNDAERGIPLWIRLRVQDRHGKDVAESKAWEQKTPQ